MSTNCCEKNPRYVDFYNNMHDALHCIEFSQLENA